MSNTDLEPLWTQTQLGLLYLHWNPLSVEAFFKPIHDIVEEMERKQEPLFEDLTFGDANPVPHDLWPDLQGVLLSNLRDAIVQAQRECIAVTQAKTLGRQERNKLLSETASQARHASEARLRSTFSFPCADTARTLTPRQQLEASLVFSSDVLTVLCEILREGNETPTLSNVAKYLLPDTQQNTPNGNDTGKSSLSRRLAENNLNIRSLVSLAEALTGRKKLTKRKKQLR